MNGGASMGATIIVCLVGGCSNLPPDSFFRSDGWLATTYKTPMGPHAHLNVYAPDRTTTPLFVELCSEGQWKKAAVLGPGLVKIGGILFSDSKDVASNPKAVRLPNQSNIDIPVNQVVKFRIRSHKEFADGNILGLHTTSSCQVQLAITAKSEETYRATWYRHPGSCEVKTVKVNNTDGTESEQEVQQGDLVPSC